MSKLETALAAIVSTLDGALSDCTVQADFDLPVPWETLTTARFVNVQAGTLTPETRTGVTTWFCAPVLELHVRADDHTTLRTKALALFADVHAALLADDSLGGACRYVEIAEGAASEVTVNETVERGAAASMQVPLALVVVTTAADLAA